MFQWWPPCSQGVLTFQHKSAASSKTQALSKSGLTGRYPWCNPHLLQQVWSPEPKLSWCSTRFLGPFESEKCLTYYKSWFLSTVEERCRLELFANKLHLSYHSTEQTRSDGKGALARERRSKIWNKHTIQLSYHSLNVLSPDAQSDPRHVTRASNRVGCVYYKNWRPSSAQSIRILIPSARTRFSSSFKILKTSHQARSNHVWCSSCSRSRC
jgi:hypothetical protein